MASPKSVIIRSSTWQEEAPIEFEVKEVNIDKNVSYPLTLTNPDNESQEVYPIENTLLISISGAKEDEAVNMVFSESLIHDFDGEMKYNDDGNIVFDLKPDKKVFELGMSVGLYFNYDELPLELKNFKIQFKEGE
jgi:hypothetical protein